MARHQPTRQVWPVIRVYISSTFGDLKHERYALQERVWPILEQYCECRGFQFQAIDLRWAISTEATLDHSVMQICRQEIRRSQEMSPGVNFLVLLGNRYGWRPLPEVISVAEFLRLEAAASEVATAAANDPTKDVRLRRASEVLQQWYLLDENAKPFGEQAPAGEYVLRSRKTSPDGLDYGRQPDATGKLRDTAAWVDVQIVLWSIVNRAFPAADLAGRFQTLHETSPGTVPSTVRFQASATEQEIWHGSLQVANADRHVIAAVREIVDLDAFPNTPWRGDFIDLKDDGTPDDDARQAVADLKAELERRLSRSPIIRSRCRWAIDQDHNPTGDVTTSHLDDFCREILARFKSIIIEQITDYWGCDLSADDATLAQVRGSQQELDLECADHVRFAGERAPEKTFVGRSAELRRIRKYLLSDTNQPHVVHGPSGSGKTALMGRAILKLKKVMERIAPSRSADGTRAKTGPIVLVRFIGTTPESSNLRSLLSSLCRELRQVFEMTSPLPTDLNKLLDEFYLQLDKATAARPIFVFLDAVDQLDAADNGRSVFWIRSPLSLMPAPFCHARMVVSCLSPSDEFPEDSAPCGPYRELKDRPLLGNHELGALGQNDARQLFARWLHRAGRSVSEAQQEIIWSAIQTSSACRQPLFLKVLFEEARRWRSFDTPSAIPDSLAQLLDELFIRLGKPSEHGRVIGIAMSCLGSARYGLSEGELLEVLYADPEYKAILAEDNKRNRHELHPDSNRIPIAAWTRLRCDLAPYLSERAAPGSSVMHFYHRQVEQAVRKRYLRTPELQTSRHRQLADYFTAQDYWVESLEEQQRRAKTLPPTPRPANVRKVDELPWQLLQAGDWQRSEQLLTDLAFLEAKAEAGMVFDLATDFTAAIAGMPADRALVRILRLLAEALRRDIHFIARHPTTLFQCLWNSCWWYDCSEAADHYVEGRAPGQDSGAKLSRWLESFRADKERETPGFVWLRSLRPPPLHLGTAQKAVLRGHYHWVWSVAYSPDGQRLASASWDRTVRVWDMTTGSELLRLKGHQNRVMSVAFSPDGRQLASGSLDRTARIWDAATGAQLFCLIGHESAVASVAYSPDGRRLASGGSAENTMRVWDAATGAELFCLKGHQDGVWSVAYSPDGRHLASGSFDKTVRVWDAATGAELSCLKGHQGGVWSIAYSPDGRHLASGSSDKTVRVWDAATGAEVLCLKGHECGVYSVAYSGDGRWLASGSSDKTVRVWNPATGTGLFCLKGHQSLVKGLTYSPDSRWLATGSHDRTVRVWEASKGDQLFCLKGHNRNVWSAAYSPDSRRVASGSDDHTVRVWNAATGTEIFCLKGHEGTVYCLAYSPDGRHLASGSADKTVRVWDAATGAELLCLKGHEDCVQGLAWSFNGQRLASSEFKPVRHCRMVRVWDAVTGESLEVDSRMTFMAQFAAAAERPSFVATPNWLETILLLPVGQSEPIAWFPDAHPIAASPDDRSWAGAASEYLWLFSLDGEPEP